MLKYNSHCDAIKNTNGIRAAITTTDAAIPNSAEESYM